MTFFDRLRNAWELLKLTFQFLKRDKSLLAIPILLPIVNLAAFTLFAIMAVFIIHAVPENTPATTSNIAGIIILALFFFIMSFANTFFGAAHSWMVYEVTQGKDTTLSNGLRRALHNFFDIFLFALATMLVRIATNFLRGNKKEGFDAGYIIRNMLANWIDTLTTVLGKLVLPAMIITEKTFTESVTDLKQSVHTWPEILAFEVGVQPLVNLATGIISFIFLIFTILTLPTLFGWFFLTILILTLLAGSVLKSFVNATYYTLLYIALVQKKKITGVKDVFAQAQ